MLRLSLLAILAALSVSSVGLLALGVTEEARSTPGARGPSVDPTLDGQGSGADALLPATGMRFGIDAGSVDRFSERAGAPDYATIWVGKWTLDRGWKNTDVQLTKLRDQGVTPAVHLYYWGDDLGGNCLWNGCNGKDQAGWQRLTDELTAHLAAIFGDKPVLVILESEFNKHGVHEDEGFDQLLADKATAINTGYPPAEVVLGLGNWYPKAWATWDRAAAASDYVGLQAIAGSTHDSPERTVDLARKTLDGVERLRGLFGKPVVIQDVAVSSYPEPDHLETQGEAMARFAEELPALQEAGVVAVLYRSYLDIPDMALHNHYAEAERHWGLAWHDTGELKPAGEAWMAAVEKARHPPAPANLTDVAGPQPA
jgi:hypothetical protein